MFHSSNLVSSTSTLKRASISFICHKCFTHQIWCHPPVRSKEHLPSTCYNNMHVNDDHVKLKRASALTCPLPALAAPNFPLLVREYAFAHGVAATVVCLARVRWIGTVAAELVVISRTSRS